MGAQINLFYKFTRKTEIGVEEVFVAWSSLDDLVGGGPYFAPGPDEVGGGASRGERGAGGGVQRSRDALSRGFGMLDF